MVLLHQVGVDGFQIDVVERFALLDVRKRGENLLRRGKRVESRRPPHGKQLRHEIGAIGGQLEQRLVHEVQIQVAPPDVDDERQLRLERGDVVEVLLRTHADVHAGGYRALHQIRQDVGKSELVREQIVGSEIAVGLGEVRGESREFPVGN